MMGISPPNIAIEMPPQSSLDKIVFQSGDLTISRWNEAEHARQKPKAITINCKGQIEIQFKISFALWKVGATFYSSAFKSENQKGDASNEASKVSATSEIYTLYSVSLESKNES